LGNLPSQAGKFAGQKYCAIKLLNFVACLTWALRLFSFTLLLIAALVLGTGTRVATR